MRYYPTKDPNFYWEVYPGWMKCCHNPCITWKRPPLEEKHAILYWRDLEGKDMEYVLHKDLFFENWPDSRIRWEACLPIYYCVGARFIRLEKALMGFKCTPMPLNLKEAREMKAYLKQLAKERRRQAKLLRKQKRAERLAAQKNKNGRSSK